MLASLEEITKTFDELTQEMKGESGKFEAEINGKWTMDILEMLECPAQKIKVVIGFPGKKLIFGVIDKRIL